MAIVTGLARGIGRGVAQRLAHHGANVVINDIGDPTGPSEVLKGLGAEGGATAHNAEIVSGRRGYSPSSSALLSFAFRNQRPPKLLVGMVLGEEFATVALTHGPVLCSGERAVPRDAVGRCRY